MQAAGDQLKSKVKYKPHATCRRTKQSSPKRGVQKRRKQARGRRENCSICLFFSSICPAASAKRNGPYKCTRLAAQVSATVVDAVPTSMVQVCGHHWTSFCRSRHRGTDMPPAQPGCTIPTYGQTKQTWWDRKEQPHNYKKAKVAQEAPSQRLRATKKREGGVLKEGGEASQGTTTTSQKEKTIEGFDKVCAHEGHTIAYLQPLKMRRVKERWHSGIRKLKAQNT